MRRNTRRLSHTTLTATATLLLSCPLTTEAHGFAQAHPASAVNLYQQGLALKKANPKQALIDFQNAAEQDPNWEAPEYEAGAMLAVSNFSSAIPVLQHAASLNPADDTVWNILGWGYYQKRDYVRAEQAFTKQLQVNASSPYALWGLANCYANNQVRAFTTARNYLNRLLSSAPLHAEAAHLLAMLPPANVDGTNHPDDAITYEDAIAITLSYRSDVAHTTATPVVDSNGKPADSAVAAYVAWAFAHHLLDGLTIPSFHAPAPRLFTAVFMSRFYGLDRFEYIRPFPLVDMGAVSVNNRMYVNSILANRLMTVESDGHFEPSGVTTRAAFNKLVQNANAVMQHPPTSTTWLTPPARAPRTKPFLYFFQTSDPNQSIQQQDMQSHASEVSAIGLTTYPFIGDVRSDLGAHRKAVDGTTYLLTPRSGGPEQEQVLADVKRDGLQPFMVLGNYNQATNQSDPVIVDHLLSNPADVSGLTAEAVRVAQSEHLAGITVDFENVPRTDRAKYVAFMRALHQSAVQANLTTMVCLPEEDGASGVTAYDYSGLAKNADLVMLITYDEHTPGSLPGAIHETFNDDRVVKFALEQIPASKLLIGAADYGYDWSNGSGVEISQQQAESIVTRSQPHVTIDSASDSPTFNYVDDKGVKHIVWFEDDHSLASVFRMVHTYGLRGVAVWHLGSDNALFWHAWHQTFSN